MSDKRVDAIRPLRYERKPRPDKSAAFGYSCYFRSKAVFRSDALFLLLRFILLE